MVISATKKSNRLKRQITIVLLWYSMQDLMTTDRKYRFEIIQKITATKILALSL